jgi:hypothetical protein
MRTPDRGNKREDPVTKQTARAPKPLTHEEGGINRINKLIKELPKEIDKLLRPEPGKPDLQITLTDPAGNRVTQAWTTVLEELTSRQMVDRINPANGSKISDRENFREYEKRSNDTLEKIRSSLYDQHIKALIVARVKEIQSIVEDTNTKIEADIRGLPGKTAAQITTLIDKSRLDRRTIIEQARQHWFGPVIDETTKERIGGTITAKSKKAISDSLSEACKRNFDKIIAAPNKDTKIGEWVRSVTNLQDSELEKIKASGILKAQHSDCLRNTQASMGFFALGSAVAAGGSVLLSWYAAAPAIASTAAYVAASACIAAAVRQSFKLIEFDTLFQTVWTTTLKQLTEPANMDTARAFSGLFFRVIRDYNPIPAGLRPHNTDFWRNSPDKKDTALLNSIKAGAAYAAEVSHYKALSRDPEKPLEAVAADEKFGTYITRVKSELDSFSARWYALPTLYRNTTIGSAVVSGMHALGYLL